MIFNSILAMAKQLNKRPITYRDLIQREAKIGGRLFGPIPEGHRREFFCLDERTWVWHEEWLDVTGKLQSITTRFEVHPDRIMKVQNGEYYKIDRNEALNFFKAARLYIQKVRTQLYTQAV